MGSENRDIAGRPVGSNRGAFRSWPRWGRWGAGILAVLLLLLAILFVASYFLDEPLRRSTEQRMNQRLKGYTVRVPKLHFQLVGLIMTVEGLEVIQQAYPDPPIARFPEMEFDVHWRALLRGKLVGEVFLGRPEVRIDLRQFRAEAASPVPLKERGWQHAVAEMYPFKINALTVRDGKLTYIDQDKDRPLVLSGLNLDASNIRNIFVPENVYPSAFHMETAVFGTGRGIVEGNANFLAEPHLGIDARLKLENIPLGYFKPVVARTNLSVRKGVFSGSGRIEYAPNVKVTHLHELTIRGLEIDYVHTGRTAEEEKRRAAEVGKAVKEAPKSEMLLRVDHVRFQDCAVGMKNEDANPPYRVFLADADLRLENLSNKFSQGPAELKLQGKFMGSGPTMVTANFRPEVEGPDLDLQITIEDTQLTDMNDVFRAYGKFDVSGGTFAFVSELRVKNDRISGYIKPFFKDMKVYDERDDREKKVFRQLYEMLVGGVAKLLERKERDVVAAKADISGPVSKPKVSSWQIIGNVIQNAFFKAILPEFEKQASESKRKGSKP